MKTDHADKHGRIFLMIQASGGGLDSLGEATLHSAPKATRLCRYDVDRTPCFALGPVDPGGSIACRRAVLRDPGRPARLPRGPEQTAGKITAVTARRPRCGVSGECRGDGLQSRCVHDAGQQSHRQPRHRGVRLQRIDRLAVPGRSIPGAVRLTAVSRRYWRRRLAT